MTRQAIKVLIVEDEPLVAADIRIKLEYFGYQVTAIVESGPDAIDNCAQNLPDLILMDIVLAGAIDGIETAAIIGNQYGAPIIYLTSHIDQRLLQRAKITEPLAYLLKPCDARDLHATLSVALYKAELDKHRHESNLLDATIVSLSTAVVAWDVSGKIIRINQALLKLLGATEPTVLLGNQVTELVLLKNAHNGCLITQELVHITEQLGRLADERELLLVCTNLNTVPVRVSGNRIQDARGHCLGHVLLIHDDTLRKQQHQALKESELRFQQLVSHLDCLFCICETQNGTVLHLNRAYEKIFARPLPSNMSKEALFIEHTYGQDLEKTYTLMQAIHARIQHETQFRIVRPDHSLRWLHVRIYPVKDPATAIIYRMAFIIDDVTERKEAEVILQQHARIFDNTAEGIMVTDADLNIVAINNAFTTITGFTEDDVLNSNPRILRSGHHDNYFFEIMWASIRESGNWQGEIYNRRKNGELYPQWMTVSTIHDDHGQVMNYFAIFSDISAIKQSQEALDYLAHYDHLTGFANRLLFNARLEHAIEQADRSNEKIAVLLMDLDRFKGVNDSLGHAIGDQLLKQVAERLKDCLREEDTLARQGGDEFIFILEGLKNSSDMLWLAEKILALFIKPFVLEEHEIIITASLGISIYPDDGQDGATLVKQADMAMYKAKHQGKNRHAFYTEDLNANSILHLTLATQMRQGLERDEFIVYYQPQISLLDKQITGFEALIRWRHPTRGLVMPAEFIQLAEDSGFIEKLGEWVLYEACRQCKAWQSQGCASFTVAVNISAVQFIYSDIVETVQNVLKKTGLAGRFLELEITESCLMNHLDQVLLKLDGLKALDVSLSIDDFGTGYSSLSYLKGFPIDKLKIDRSFVKNLPEDCQDSAIAKAIIAMGKSLDLIVIAEGTETIAQQNFLIANGCDEMQGYLFSKPLPANEIATLFLKF